MGVEAIAHGAALLKLGCKLAQDYGVARPMHRLMAPTFGALIHHVDVNIRLNDDIWKTVIAGVIRNPAPSKTN